MIKKSLLALAFALPLFSHAAENHYVGRHLYLIACANCHSPELSKGIGAPTAFDKKAWAQRLSNAEKISQENPKEFPNKYAVLLTNVKKGKGFMHHGGLCKESSDPKKDCSDEAYIEAIRYMSGES